MLPNMLDPRQLALLQEVARTGSYSAAGRALGFTQPAITYQMRSLEKQVGAPLTVRTGRTMQLTETGRVLLAHAERIIAALRAAEDDLQARRDNGKGRIRLAAFASSCATLVPIAMVALRRSHPNIEVELIQAEPPVARSLIRCGEADLALSYHVAVRPSRGSSPVPHTAGLASLPVLSERIHLVMPMDHPEAGQRLISLSQLRDETFILASPHLEDLLGRMAAKVGFTPRILPVADDYVLVQAMAASGFGVAFVPTLALRAHRDPRIVSRTLRGLPQRHIQVEAWPDMLHVDAVRAMIEQLNQVGAALRTEQQPRRPTRDRVLAIGADPNCRSDHLPRRSTEREKL